MPARKGSIEIDRDARRITPRRSGMAWGNGSVNHAIRKKSTAARMTFLLLASAHGQIVSSLLLSVFILRTTPFILKIRTYAIAQIAVGGGRVVKSFAAEA